MMRNDNSKFTWVSLSTRKNQLKRLKADRARELDASEIERLDSEIARMQQVIADHPENQS